MLEENLVDGRNLAVITDFKSIISKVAGKHLNINNNTALLPEWKMCRIGVMK